MPALHPPKPAAVVKPEAPSTNGSSARGFAGQPRGLATLFFTELWERFSYYGMRALLVLFIVAPAATGGLGLSTAEAARIYGNYTMAVYMLSIPGGFIADRYLGARRSVLIGGSIIALGHFTLAVDSLTAFYGGLGLVALGTGLRIFDRFAQDAQLLLELLFGETALERSRESLGSLEQEVLGRAARCRADFRVLLE